MSQYELKEHPKGIAVVKDGATLHVSIVPAARLKEAQALSAIAKQSSRE